MCTKKCTNFKGGRQFQNFQCHHLQNLTDHPTLDFPQFQKEKHSSGTGTPLHIHVLAASPRRGIILGSRHRRIQIPKKGTIYIKNRSSKCANPRVASAHTFNSALRPPTPLQFNSAETAQRDFTDIGAGGQSRKSGFAEYHTSNSPYFRTLLYLTRRQSHDAVLYFLTRCPH